MSGLFTPPSTPIEWIVMFIFIALISAVIPPIWKILELLGKIHDRLMDIEDRMKKH